MKYLIALFVAMWCVMVAPVQAKMFPEGVYFVCTIGPEELERDPNFDPHEYCQMVAKMRGIKLHKLRGIGEDHSYTNADTELVYMMYFAEPADD